MNKRIVIFGKSGFISSHLSKHFRRKKIKTLVLSKKNYDLTQSKVVDKLKKIIKEDDVMIFTSYDKNADIQTNILMIENMLKSLRNFKYERLIYLSSDSIYEKKKMPINEDSACLPSDDYGKMHQARENILKKFFKSYKKKLLILRLSSIYGFGHYNYGPARFIRSALSENKIYIYGHGEEKRCHIYIDDFAEILLTLIKKNIHGILNITSNKPISFKKITEIIQGNLDKKILIIKEKRKLSITKCLFNWIGLKIFKNNEKFISKIYFDTNKLNKITNLNNIKYMNKNITKLINIYKKRLKIK